MSEPLKLPAYTVVYRRFQKKGPPIGPQLRVEFPTLEAACRFGHKEFSLRCNYDAHLILPSGTSLIFTKMYGLV